MSANFGFTIASVLILLLINSFIDAIPSPRRQMPKECEGQNYCSIPSHDYPYEKIDNILSKMNIAQIENNQISHRVGNNIVESICEQTEQNEKVYQIVDEHGDVRDVVQNDKILIQTIGVSKCLNPGRLQSGNGIIDSLFLEDFIVSCVETKLEHQFLVLSHDGHRLEISKPTGGIPVGCHCRYTETNGN